MKTIKKYSVNVCIISAVIVLLLSFVSYLFGTFEERILFAQAACVLALVGIIIGLLKFDEKD